LKVRALHIRKRSKNEELHGDGGDLLLWVLAQFRLVLHTVSISRAEVAMLGCTGII
jgi:hypothetical protein